MYVSDYNILLKYYKIYIMAKTYGNIYIKFHTQIINICIII